MGDLNVGIVGVGWVAGAHIETYKAVNGANVTAVCSRRKLDPAELEKQYGLPLKVYNDYDTFLKESGVDVVDICTPHPMHAKQAIAAAEAGKHLIIEKPICLSWEDAKAIKEAIDKAGVKACVCFEVRFSAHFQLVKSVIDEGLLGELHYGEADYYRDYGEFLEAARVPDQQIAGRKTG